MFNKQYIKDNEYYDAYGEKVDIKLNQYLKCISPEGFKKFLVDEYAKDNTLNYLETICNSCRRAIPYAIIELNKKDRFLTLGVKVATGIVNDSWHCWLIIHNYYIDLTMQQFNPDAPELFIIKKDKAEQEGILIAEKVYSIHEWVEFEETH